MDYRDNRQRWAESHQVVHFYAGQWCTFTPALTYLNVTETHMQAAGQIHAPVKRFSKRVEPVIGNDAAAIGDTDHQSARARLRRRCNRNIRYIGDRLATLETQLPETPIGPPVDDATRGFGGQLIVRVTEKQQIRLLNGFSSAHFPCAFRPYRLPECAALPRVPQEFVDWKISVKKLVIQLDRNLWAR